MCVCEGWHRVVLLWVMADPALRAECGDEVQLYEVVTEPSDSPVPGTPSPRALTPASLPDGPNLGEVLVAALYAFEGSTAAQCAETLRGVLEKVCVCGRGLRGVFCFARDGRMDGWVGVGGERMHRSVSCELFLAHVRA